MGGRKCVRPRSSTSAVGYIRVSTEEQTLDPEAQRVALARWAKARKIQLVAVHEDRGVSGAAPLDRRPGLIAALASLESHSAAFLVAVALTAEGYRPRGQRWHPTSVLRVVRRDELGRTPPPSGLPETSCER